MAILEIKLRTLYSNKGVNAARKALEALKNSGGQAVQNIKQSFSGLGGAISSEMKTMAGMFTVGAVASGLSAVAVGSFKAAEAARSATSSFESLSGGAEIARLNLQAMNKATRGLASDTEQMQIANQLLGMRIVSTSDELEQVVSVSRRLGKEFRGLGAREAAEEFAIMVSNMSVARLDSFGISSGRVRKRIDELMRTTEGMTREQAFFQATMEEGEETLSRLGPELTTSADEISRMSAEWTNLQAALGGFIESTGIVRGLIKGITDDLVRFQAAFLDDSPEAQVKALEVQLATAEERLATLEGRGNSFFGIFAAQVPGAQEAVASLKDELALLNAEQEKVNAGAREQQEALQAAIRSEEIAAENAEKRAESAKKLKEAQEQFARDMIDIQAETEQELSDARDQFDKDTERAAEDHAKRIASIKKRFAKDEVKQEKRLEKDLLKLDKNLAKSLEKSTIDESKKVAKAKQDFAKQDRTEAKRKQIDALGDERLFQFELRNLAADGEGIAIKEALERREIEKQIASEKAEFEKSVEQDKRKDQIDSIRQEGQEARAQLEQQAADRRTDLQERAEEARADRAERIAEELAQEAEVYQEKKIQLAEGLAEQEEAIRESEHKRVEEIAKGLAETEELTMTELDSMVNLAKEFGEEFGTVFADGITKAFTENLKIDEALENVGQNFGAGGGLPQPSTNGIGPSRGGLQPFQAGGMVQQTGPIFAHSGEVVANPAQGQAIIIDGEQIAVHQAERLATLINGVLDKYGQTIIDTVAASL